MTATSTAAASSSGDAQRPNTVYYFGVGVGDWRGGFRFAITDWWVYRQARIGATNRFLTLGMHVLTALFGPAPIVSRLVGDATAGEAGIVTNDVRITKFRIPLYLLFERYVLNPDGRWLTVESRERFGPVPFLFNRRKTHPAEILDGGMRAIYYIPLLGADWVATYQVRADRRHIDSIMRCDWGEAQETIDRVGV